ncbi:MAG: FAD:protein FMN transferase [Pseudomonadota bacterium]
MASCSRSKPLLGTFVEVDLVADVDQPTLLEASTRVFDRITEIQGLMSFHDPDSELSRVNRDAFKMDVPVSKDMRRVIASALELSLRTNGHYDISVAGAITDGKVLPNRTQRHHPIDWQAIRLGEDFVRFERDLQIDLGGIAKGFAVDCAFDLLAELPINFEQIVVNAGGDLRMFDWQDQEVTIRRRRRTVFVRQPMITMRNRALACSRSGYGSPSSVAVDVSSGKIRRSSRTWGVFAPSCMMADALTKVVGLRVASQHLIRHYNAQTISIPNTGQAELSIV